MHRSLWRVAGALALLAWVSVACGDDDTCTVDSTGDEVAAEDCVDGQTADGEACTCSAGDDGGGGSVLSVNNTSASVQTGSGTLTVQVPENATSVALVVEGLGSKLLLAEKITSPSGKVVFDFNEDINDNLTKADDEVYTVVIPNNPDVELEAGDWQVVFLTDAADFQANVKAVYNTGSPGDTLNLNLIFVGVDGLDAATAAEDAGFQDVLSDFGEVYGQVGVDVGEVRYFDASDSDADQFGVLRDTAINDLLATSGSGLTDASGNGVNNNALNFFFVSDITGGDEGFSLLGLSGGVPGPPTLNGTRKSGVVVNMSDFADNPGDIVTIMAHEGGHFLGLYHTTERNGAGLVSEDDGGIVGADHLSDTEVCPDSADANGNSSLSASECETFDGGNLMFFSPAVDSPRTLSAKQGQVIKANPILR